MAVFFGLLFTAVMPLNTAPNPFELSSYEDIKENFVIFYSSRDESGRMWCPVRRLSQSMFFFFVICSPPSHMFIRRYRRHQDCREVEDLIARTFALADGPSGLIIYVGQRAECVTQPPLGHLSPISIGQKRKRCRSYHPL